MNATRIGVVCALAVLAGSCGGEPEGQPVADSERRQVAIQFAHAVVTKPDVGQAMKFAVPEVLDDVREQVSNSFASDWRIVGTAQKGCPPLSIALAPLPRGPCYRFRLRSAVQIDPGAKYGEIMRGLLMVAVTSETLPPKVTALAYSARRGSFVKLP